MSDSDKPGERINPISSMEQFRRLFAFVQPHRGRLAVALLVIVGGSVLGLAGPYTLQFLIDAVFRQNNAALLNRITLILMNNLFVGCKPIPRLCAVRASTLVS
jgi:ABC-type bacteriocin/lantibiotic exporter with double-glycine peptidase domain